MNLWWCQEHLCGSQTNTGTNDDKCLYAREFGEDGCRMVEMRLAPADALVIERDWANTGGWPTWLHNAMWQAVGFDALHALNALNALNETAVDA